MTDFVGIQTAIQVLQQLDKVIFGPYMEELKVPNPMFGSANQRVVEHEEIMRFYGNE